MPFQDFLSHFAFLSPPTFEHCQSSLSNNAVSGFPFSFWFLSPPTFEHCQSSLSNNALSRFPFSCCVSLPTYYQCQSSLSNNVLSGFPFSFCVSVPTIIVKQCPFRISFLILRFCPHHPPSTKGGSISSLSVPPKQLGLQLNWSTGIIISKLLNNNWLVYPKHFPLTSQYLTQTISPQKGYFNSLRGLHL